MGKNKAERLYFHSFSRYLGSYKAEDRVKWMVEHIEAAKALGLNSLI